LSTKKLGLGEAVAYEVIWREIAISLKTLPFGVKTYYRLIMFINPEARFRMFAAAFSILVMMVLVTGAFYLVMRIRLMRMDSARDRIEWLSLRGGDEVLDTYEALFPRSVLPRFCRFVFWAFITVVAVGLCTILILKAFGK
jgi:hypothetical protein